MEFDFVYADLQLTVTCKAQGYSPFRNLNDNEVHCLGLLFRHSIDNFLVLRALYVTGLIDSEKSKDDKPPTDEHCSI